MWKYDYFTVNKAYLNIHKLQDDIRYQVFTSDIIIQPIMKNTSCFPLKSSKPHSLGFPPAHWQLLASLDCWCSSLPLSSSWSAPEAHLWISFHLCLHWLPWRFYLNLVDLSTIHMMVALTFTSTKLYLHVSSCQLSMSLCLSDRHPTHAENKTKFPICAH